ncbi:MAG: NrdH-redoxin [Burkholderiales bacterium RIFCSPHIGHO2_12_FULL_61_11]|nr:MAG: NrdH-redoxin [Burkholderiales bacterium RIFCSPHIGHO2_12_FULL_61_11]
MRSTTVKFLTLNALIVLAASLSLPIAQAQQVYRIVGSDGKLTFSDQPPPAASNAKVSAAKVSSTGPSVSAGLPYELRQVTSQYPVTLYTGDNCAPCGAGRSLLSSRGIPFTEKKVTTNEDAQALQRLSGDNSLPFMTIGSQQLMGFSDAEWTQFLNAAGYPASSALPASYRRPAPTPLVSVATAPEAPVAGAAPAAGANQRPAPRATQPANNPAGIRF